MVRKQGPGKAREFLFWDQPNQPIDKVLPIGIILEDPTPFDTAKHHVMDDTGRVQPRLPRHWRLPRDREEGEVRRYWTFGGAANALNLRATGKN